MKALPIVLISTAACFGVLEWNHGRLHDEVASNHYGRIVSIQKPGAAAVPQNQVRDLKTGPIGIGARIGRYVGVGHNPTPSPPPPSAPPPAPDLNKQVDDAQQHARNDKATMDAADNKMFVIRISLTAVLLPISFYIVLAKAKYGTGDKGCAYATIAAVLAFWARS